MNLQSIQKRLQELSAEALTLSNDLEFLIKGDVSRVAPEGHKIQVYNFKQVNEGDILQFTAPFAHIESDKKLPAGDYIVDGVEEDDYAGKWSVMVILPDGDNTWTDLNSIAAASPVYKVQVA